MKPKSRFHCRRPAHMLAITMVLSHLPQVHAADGTWLGGGSTGDWSDSSNWIDGIFAGGADATGTLLPAAPGGNPINLGSSLTLGGISFSSSEGNPTQWTLSSNADPAATLTLAKTGQAPVILVGANVAAEISVSIAGSQGLNKTGSGSLTLSAANLYTGVTTISEGALRLSGSGSISNVTLSGSASMFDISRISAASYTLAGLSGISGSTIVLGEKSLNISFGSYSTQVFSGPVFSGDISGNGGLVKSGYQTLRLDGTNDYKGKTLIQGEGLQFGKQSALYNNTEASWTKDNITVSGLLALNVGGDGEFTTSNVTTLLENLTVGIDKNGFRGGSRIGFDTTNAAGGEFTITDAIHDSTGIGAGSLGVIKLGNNTLILSGANSYTGETYVFGGELVLAGNATYGGRVAVSGGTLKLADSVNLSETVSLYSSPYGNGGSFDVSGITTSEVSVGGLSGGGESSVVLGDRNLTIESSSSNEWLNFYGAISGDGGSVTKSGVNRQTLSGANTYTGTTRIEGGILAFGNRESLYNGDSTRWTKENITVQSGGILGLKVGNTGEFIAADITTILGNLTSNLNNNGMQAGTSLAFITQSDKTFNYDGNIGDGNGAGAGSLGIAMIDDGYSGNYDKGRVALSGTNTYTGKTHIASGALQFTKRSSLYGGDSAKWSAANIRVDFEGELALNIGGAGEFTSGDIQVLLSNNVLSYGRLGLDTTSGDVSLPEINGSPYLGIRKLGANTLTLGASNYGGSTYIDKGAIRLSGANNSGLFIITSEGKLILDGNGALRNDSEIYSAGSLDISGINSSGMTFKNIESAYTEIGTKNITIDSFLDNNSGSQGFDLYPDYLYSVSGTGGSLIKSGSGRLLVGNFWNPENNIFSGATVVNGGILEMNGDSEGSLIVNSGGKLELNNIHNGDAVVNGGRLNVGGLGYGGDGYGISEIHRSGSLYGNVNVKSGGTLGGHGFITEAITVESGGKLAPGTSIGSLHSGGSATFANNSTYQYEVDSSAVLAAGADLLVIQGDLNLDMTQLAFGNIAAAPESFQVGTLFSLLNYTGSWNGGLFVLGSNILEDGEQFFAGQNFWSIDYDAAIGGLNFSEDQFVSSSSRFINITATAVPEPSSILLGAAASLLLLRRRR